MRQDRGQFTLEKRLMLALIAFFSKALKVTSQHCDAEREIITHNQFWQILQHKSLEIRVKVIEKAVQQLRLVGRRCDVTTEVLSDGSAGYAVLHTAVAVGSDTFAVAAVRVAPDDVGRCERQTQNAEPKLRHGFQPLVDCLAGRFL